jgi:hypothetical protein
MKRTRLPRMSRSCGGSRRSTPARVGVPEEKYQRNALRHSFGSYRMEMVKNAGQVALEMGNSVAILMNHYFDIVEARAANEHWNIRPLPRGDRKIVRLR